MRLRDLAVSLGVMALVIAPFPLTLMLAGRTGTGESYLTWQLFRRPNHDWLFYPTTVPEAIGPLVLLAAVVGLWLLRREASWRETLLLSWIAVPVVFFQLWPVKGFQYLLPVAPRARGARRPRDSRGCLSPRARPCRPLAAIVAASACSSPRGSGSEVRRPRDLPRRVRRASRWARGGRVDRRRTSRTGATLMTIGPSMANLVQYYGHRKAYGLSVSPNPLNRNPSYEPLVNPDRAMRDSELQYIVWDTFSAARSPSFADKLLGYADRYNGRVVHAELLPARTARASGRGRPAIVVFEVRP